jgi:hypothetical protein
MTGASQAEGIVIAGRPEADVAIQISGAPRFIAWIASHSLAMTQTELLELNKQARGQSCTNRSFRAMNG